MGPSLISLALAILSLAPLKADFASGLRAYEQGDYVSALKECTPLANNGNTGAQVRIGEMFENGVGVPQNYTEGRKWHQKAAENGDAHGAYRLGLKRTPSYRQNDQKTETA
jgi:TPR repeat protein